MALSPGHRLGPYEILSRAGEGGMGEVYKARDTRLDRLVAIKVSKEQFSERFDREARVVAALSHPHICPLFDVGPNYLVMEYIAGRALKPPVPIDQVGKYALQIASALEAAHAKGIVHRDLKPSNILITPSGDAKLLDFGLARQADPATPVNSEEWTREMLTQPGVVVGTIPYMSPEQVRGQAVDGRSDLWSLGVVLYQAATGLLPFDAPTQGLALEAVLTRTPESPRERNPEIPAELDRIIARLLEKDRARRHQSAAELLADLRKLQLAPGKRRSAAAYGIAAIAVLAVLGMGIFAWQRAQGKPLTDKDVLILADFINTTGDPVFDGTLREALAIQVEESPFLKVLSDDAVRGDLALMGRKPDERVTNDIARDMCQREGQKAIIGGSIASLGKSYAITLLSTNCRTGDTLAREQAESPDKEHVLDAVAQAAKGMRRKLGESLNSIQKLERLHNSQVTTASLEAFQLFAQGLVPFRSGDFLAAIPLFKRATEVDPNFAAAWDYLGITYLGAHDSGPNLSGNLSRAFSLRERVTDRERFLISTEYYAYVTGEFTKAAETAGAWVHAYPRDNIAHTNYGVAFWNLGEIEEAFREHSEAYRIEPRVSFSYSNMVGAYESLDRFDEAKQIALAELMQNPNVALLHQQLLEIASIQGDAAAAGQQIQWFSGRPGEYLGLQQLMADAAVTGRLRQAEDFTREANALRERQRLPPLGGRLPQTDALYGNCDPARKKSAPSAVAVALCGDASQASRFAKQAQDASARRPDDTLLNAIQLPMYRAVAEWKSGHPDKSIELLEPVSHYERTHPQVIYLRGLCYLAAHKPSEAAGEFQKILDHKGAFWGPFYAASYVLLGRAAALAGDNARARKAYQDFLAFWKDADPDVPILIQARKEYAALP